MSADSHLWHQSGINSRGEPFVQLILGDKVIAQMSVEECRNHALQMFEAAEAAETDSMLVEFFQGTVGLDLNRAVQVLLDFRKLRAERFKRGGTITDQWVMPPDAQLSDEAKAALRARNKEE